MKNTIFKAFSDVALQPFLKSHILTSTLQRLNKFQKNVSMVSMVG